MKTLEKKLGIKFNNPALFLLAMRHKSMEGEDNERLEFLGDSILSFVIASELYEKYPDLDEGKLSILRSNLVKKDTLIEIAEYLDLEECLSLGNGEKKLEKSSILADALEALIAAIYLDLGFLECKKKILEWFATKLNDLSIIDKKDAKSRLQEFTQSKKYQLPSYKLIKTEGEQHKFVLCVVFSKRS